MNKRKIAFSLNELVIILTLMGILFILGAPVLKNTAKDNTIRLQAHKIQNTLKTIVDTLLNNSYFYSENNDFSSMDTDIITGLKDTEKFKRAFKTILAAPAEISCPIYNGADFQLDTCYTGTDSITWGIPPTDFFRDGVIMAENNNGFRNAYTPISVYPEYKENKVIIKNPRQRPQEISQANTNEYGNRNAIIYGIRKDGQLILLDVIDKNTYPNAIHYKAKEFLTSQK